MPYDVFPVADGDVIIATGNDGQYRKLCDVLGVAELGRDPRFATSKDRVVNRVAFNETFYPIFRRFTRGDLLPQLDAAGVPAGPINTIGEVFADPQIVHRGMRIDIDNPLAAKGTTPGLRAPIVMDGAPLAAERPAPGLGQHTDEVLSDKDWGG